MPIWTTRRRELAIWFGIRLGSRAWVLTTAAGHRNDGSVGLAGLDHRARPRPAVGWVETGPGWCCTGMAGPVNQKRVGWPYRREGLRARMRARWRKHIALHRGPAPGLSGALKPGLRP